MVKERPNGTRYSADAFSRDPDFFEFYRSMIAYATALEDTGTSMVLSPRSPFFQFFLDPSGQGPGRQGTPPAQ